MMDKRFLSVEEIAAKYRDIGQATLHGNPPGDWFQRWMDDVGTLLAVKPSGRNDVETLTAFALHVSDWVLSNTTADDVAHGQMAALARAWIENGAKAAGGAR